MKPIVNITTPERKTLLSILWIFLSVNYILCDVYTNMETAVLQQLIRGQVAGMEVTQGFLLLAAISLEIPFIMIVLSRVLPFKINRVLNITASALMIIYQLGSFFIGTAPSLHYIFFSIIEVVGNGMILLLALKWSKVKDESMKGDY